MAEILKAADVSASSFQHLFRSKDGPLTVLDFKTDRVKGEELRLRAERYRPQLEAYSGALSRVLERPVGRRVLCFLHAGETVEL